MSSWRLRLWPRKLLSQTIVLVLCALLLAQLISLWLLSNAHRRVFDNVSEEILSRRLSTVVGILESSPARPYDTALPSRHPWLRFTMIEKPTLPAPQLALEQQIAKRLERRLGDYAQGQVRVLWLEDLPRRNAHSAISPDDVRSFFEEAFGLMRLMPNESLHFLRRQAPVSHLRIETPLRDGRWLRTGLTLPKFAPLVALPTVVFVVVSSVLVLLALIWRLRQITLPLARLSRAANALGRGQSVESIPETGPEDIKNTVGAFNRMNWRLQRFVSERTHMLASLSHDLRSPITSMRLQLELMPPGEERDRLLLSLAEMLQMTEGTLAFIRNGNEAEPMQIVDIGALLASLCDDLADQGADVSFELSSRCVLSCQLVSLKRALRNLLDNAVNYGESATITLGQFDGHIEIIIQDRGPGIPESVIERVFEPFFRVEGSRSRDTGGIGLGLSIAQQIINNHGGSLQLQNTDSGLLVRVELPVADYKTDSQTDPKVRAAS